MPSPEQLLEVIRIQTEIAKLGLDLAEVMQLVVNRIPGLIDADGAAIELAEGDSMVYRAVSGCAGAHLGLRLARIGSLSGACVGSGKVLRCDDSEEDDRVDRKACRAVGVRAMIVVPLQHGEATVGVLKALSACPHKFTQEGETLLGLLSEVIGAAMFFAAELDTDVLFHKATHDGLTDLANRSLFMDRLRHLLARNSRDRRLGALVMMDMDGLKPINDTFGHRAGDAVLCEFAHRIKNAARKSDTVARLGGDEFAVILTPIDTRDGIEAAMQHLQHALQQPFVFEGNGYRLQASMGAACFPDDGTDLDALIETADRRMYAVKQGRRRQSAKATVFEDCLAPLPS